MFERFTDRSRRVVVLAQDEARRLDHNYIGTERRGTARVRFIIQPERMGTSTEQPSDREQ